MARVTYGSLITDIAGSIGGITFQRNSSGAIARRRPNFSVNSSEPQSVQQRKLIVITNLWATLTLIDKGSWDAFALLHSHVNEYSVSKNLNGFQWFLSCNLNLLSVGDPIIMTAPDWSVMVPPETFTLSANDTSFLVTFDAPYDPGTDHVVVYFTSPLRQTSLKLRRSTYLAGSVTVTDSLYISLETLYLNIINSTWANFFNNSHCSIIVRIKQVQALTGLSSPFSSTILTIGS